MSRIEFENERPPARIDPARADIVCFVGLVRSIPGAALPQSVQDWLQLHGWIGGPLARINAGAPGGRLPTRIINIVRAKSLMAGPRVACAQSMTTGPRTAKRMFAG